MWCYTSFVARQSLVVCRSGGLVVVLVLVVVVAVVVVVFVDDEPTSSNVWDLDRKCDQISNSLLVANWNDIQSNPIL